MPEYLVPVTELKDAKGEVHHRGPDVGRHLEGHDTVMHYNDDFTECVIASARPIPGLGRFEVREGGKKTKIPHRTYAEIEMEHADRLAELEGRRAISEPAEA